jgi:hypothetical protein
LVLLGVFDCTGASAEIMVLRGRVLDISGKGVEGAEVFIYDSQSTRRPADFITPKSDREGNYRIELPESRYWAVARVRQSPKYGPLLPGDRHSGEPVAIETPVERVTVQDFVVADIREMAQNKRRSRDDFVRLSGRIVDPSGTSVALAYVFAHHDRELEQYPDYVSAWSDETGRFVMYLPAGQYTLGAAVQLPPERNMANYRSVNLGQGKIDIAIDVEITLK